MAEERIEIAVVNALWDTWTKNPPRVPDNGNRLFVRWVQLDPSDPGWDDWLLAGLVGDDGVVAWKEPEMAGRPDCKQIQKKILDGKRHGRIQSADKLTKEEWGLFVGDGPVESRVSDWAKPG